MLRREVTCPRLYSSPARMLARQSRCVARVIHSDTQSLKTDYRLCVCCQQIVSFTASVKHTTLSLFPQTFSTNIVPVL